MVVMDVPRARRLAGPPGTSGHLSASAHEDASAPWPGDTGLDELEALFWSLREIRGFERSELLEGRIVVSPAGVFWHSRASLWLYDQFRDAARERGWEQSLDSDIVLPPTRDIIRPDHMLVRDAGKFSELTPTVPVEHVLLLSEVVSPSSVRDDREVKPARCARAGIPLYLLVDRLSNPMSVTLLSEPGEDGYRKSTAVQAGPGGTSLNIPAPVELTLEATTLPAPRG
jgi:Uma2 family endonuclease